MDFEILLAERSRREFGSGDGRSAGARTGGLGGRRDHWHGGVESGRGARKSGGGERILRAEMPIRGVGSGSCAWRCRSAAWGAVSARGDADPRGGERSPGVEMTIPPPELDVLRVEMTVRDAELDIRRVEMTIRDAELDLPRVEMSAPPLGRHVAPLQARPPRAGRRIPQRSRPGPARSPLPLVRSGRIYPAAPASRSPNVWVRREVCSARLFARGAFVEIERPDISGRYGRRGGRDRGGRAGSGVASSGTVRSRSRLIVGADRGRPLRRTAPPPEAMVPFLLIGTAGFEPATP